MPNYKNGKIYKIVCNTTGETYYGSTTQPLWKRMGHHRCKTNSANSKQIIERGNYDYVLVEEYPCDNKEQDKKYQEQMKEKVICECGCKVAKSWLREHKKTDIHKNIMLV